MVDTHRVVDYNEGMDKADMKKFETALKELAYLLHLLYHQNDLIPTKTGGLAHGRCKLCMKYDNMEFLG